jgi:NAD(P)-dependent dehydrogenase (short-subunit alcohol dehydrogenase family)
MRLEGKVAIVTGGATGLGRAIALRYAQEGAKVVIADQGDAQPVVAEAIAAGGEAVAVRADITDEHAVRSLVELAVSRFGGVDVLVNNAAIASTLKLTPFEELTTAEWRRVTEVNMIGTFLCIREVSPIMRAKKSGSIINFASGTAFKGTPGMLHYTATKGAVISMTRVLAQELGGSFVRVNAISPGYILTEGNLDNKAFLADQSDKAIQGRAIKRAGYPRDLVGGALFLASDESEFISGQILAIDGGSVFH